MLLNFQIFERETKREKILESRHREMKLKERTKSQLDKDKVRLLFSFMMSCNAANHLFSFIGAPHTNPACSVFKLGHGDSVVSLMPCV